MTILIELENELPYRARTCGGRRCARPPYRAADNRSYRYDDELRLTQIQLNWGVSAHNKSFTIDAEFNRNAHSKVSGEWIYDANDRLTQRGTDGDAATDCFQSICVELIICRDPICDVSKF